MKIINERDHLGLQILRAFAGEAKAYRCIANRTKSSLKKKKIMRV
jgi:hypothetical protein